MTSPIGGSPGSFGPERVEGVKGESKSFNIDWKKDAQKLVDFINSKTETGYSGDDLAKVRQGLVNLLDKVPEDKKFMIEKLIFTFDHSSAGAAPNLPFISAELKKLL